MYQPPHFRENRLSVMHDLVRAFPLGLLVGAGADGPVADLVPFLLDAEIPPHGRLRAHVARANPHWRLIAEQPGAMVLVVFQGVDAYITPSWYATKQETGKVVPTWNYAMVQVTGHARAIEDREWIARQITDLTRQQEGRRETPWAVSDAPADYVAAQIKGIVGIEIDILAIDGKWKVSQNRSEADRAGVAAGLDRSPDMLGATEMAELVRRSGG